MAAEHRKPFFLFRPGFVLFCLYVAAYAWLRSAGDIDMQSITLPSPRGSDVFRMVGPNPDLAHWRQQFYRAFFSLPMVVEEEGRKHEGTLRNLYRQASGGAEGGDRMARDQPQQYQPQYYQQPVRQQQYRQPQYQQQVQYPLLNEGERVIYMPTPEEQRRQ